MFVVIFFAQTASVVYNDTYIRYRSLYEPTLWKRCFRNQRYYSDGTSKLLGQSFAYRTQKSMWLCNSNFLKRINITALYYNVTDFLQVVLSPDQIVISNTSLLAQVQWGIETAQKKAALTFSKMKFLLSWCGQLNVQRSNEARSK